MGRGHFCVQNEMQENNTVSLFNINISCGSQQDAKVSACTNILGEILASELSVIKLLLTSERPRLHLLSLN